MNKKLDNVTLLELLPENLRNDVDIIAASHAVDSEFQDLVSSIKNCLTIADIDNAASDVVDNLAGEINVDFYNQLLSLDKRRELVKNGYLYKYCKGTAYAVKQIVKDAFDQTEVKEWFQYGGHPFHFKISTETNLPSISKITGVVNAINSVKNARSTLESVEALKTADFKEYYGFGVQQTFYHRVVMHSLLTWEQLDNSGLTWDQLDAEGLTWSELEGNE
jgi:phage tail P2-like protein